MQHALNWFEIPATDIDRATKFYNTIFDIQMSPFEMMPGFMMAQFPADEGGVSGAVVAGEGYVPSADGSLIYLNGSDDLNTILQRVDGAGGSVVVPKTDIGDIGFFAVFLDTEGNKVALQSKQ